MKKLLRRRMGDSRRRSTMDDQAGRIRMAVKTSLGKRAVEMRVYF